MLCRLYIIIRCCRLYVKSVRCCSDTCVLVVAVDGRRTGVFYAKVLCSESDCLELVRFKQVNQGISLLLRYLNVH